jgi:hypothetical protein
MFHIRANCKARCSALPARALHKGPLSGTTVPVEEVWDRAPGVSRAIRTMGTNSSFDRVVGPKSGSGKLATTRIQAGSRSVRVGRQEDFRVP